MKDYTQEDLQKAYIRGYNMADNIHDGEARVADILGDFELFRKDLDQKANMSSS